MAWGYAVVEARHDIQNPTSREKIRLLAQMSGCRLTCVEKAEEFVQVARQRITAAGLQDRIELIHADAAGFPLEPARYDAALCLGATPSA